MDILDHPMSHKDTLINGAQRNWVGRYLPHGAIFAASELSS